MSQHQARMNQQGDQSAPGRDESANGSDESATGSDETMDGRDEFASAAVMSQ